MLRVHRGHRDFEPLKAFDASPITGQPVKVLEGRYGVYVSDGTTNATLPKDLAPEDLSFEKALDLLADLAENDQDLMAWVIGQAPAPAVHAALLAQVADHARTRLTASN